MKFGADPAILLLLRKVAPLSLCLGGAGAIALALINLSFPLIGSSLSTSLQYEILTVLYLFIGGLLAVLIYRAWGAASCLADINLWIVALLAGLGGGVIQSAFCETVSRLSSATLVSNLIVACTSSYRRTVIYGGILAVVLITFGVWVVVRYMTWQVRKNKAS
jgi:hypothetical protein